MSETYGKECIHEDCSKEFDTEMGMKVHFSLTHDATAPWVENRDYVPTSEYYDKCVDEKGRECVVCGRDRKFCIHHIDGDRQNNDLDNLIPVCWSCHGKIHHGGQECWEWYWELPPESRRSDPEYVEQKTVDSSGRVYLGSEFTDKDVKIAVEVVDEE